MTLGTHWVAMKYIDKKLFYFDSVMAIGYHSGRYKESILR